MPRSAREARASTAFSHRHGCCFRPGMQQPRRFFARAFVSFVANAYLCPRSLTLNIYRYDTHHNVEGHPIREYRDIISAETIIGANFVKDFFARLTDVFGGRSNSYERVLREGKETALAELRKAAQDVGGNAVVGVKLDYETVGASGSMLMVVATGTAVVI